MIKILSLSLTILVITFFTGCGKKAEPLIYHWGDYSYTATAYAMYGEKKEVLEKHLAELKKIIDESDGKKLRVAPGIYAEYGQILYETNKKTDAKTYLLLEKQVYPESTVFIDRVLLKLYGENQ